MRLGELLVEAGAITPDQLTEALRAQVMWGARLGTSLVELGHIDLDALSNALGYQQHLPAALASHFDRADRKLQQLLSPNHADKFEAVPLFRVGQKAVVVASTEPLDEHALEVIADELGITRDKIIESIAPELRIRYALERVYQIMRPQRFQRAPGSARAVPVALSFTGQQPLEVPAPIEVDLAPSGERRRYVRTLADGPAEVPSSKQRAMTIDGVDEELPAVLSAIERAPDRERVAKLAIAAIAHLEPATVGASLLTMRGAVAVSWTSFRRDGKPVAALAIPTEPAGVVATALRHNDVARALPGEGSELDERLLGAFGLEWGGLLAAPVSAGGRVVGLVVIAAREAGTTDTIEAIARAASKAFERLMREATG
ncbi:MAG: hypothetical protein JO257_27065 [Deltaproteobacteria bacterium]|nr:hypothetical protein [Deltaproteobacteria bacterium]